jgi:hypothetical protein
MLSKSVGSCTQMRYRTFPNTFGFGTKKFHPSCVQGTKVLVKYTAVKLLHKSNVCVPTESVVSLLPPCKPMLNSHTNVADMVAFTLTPKNSLPQKTLMLNLQLIHQETIMTAYQKIKYDRVRSKDGALVQ